MLKQGKIVEFTDLELSKINQNVGQESSHWELIKKSYFRMADKHSLLITFESFKKYWEDFTGLKKMKKIINQIYFKIFSPENNPVNLFRFTYVMNSWFEHPIKNIFEILDISNS